MREFVFVHVDKNAGSRNSDGLEFVYVDDWHDQRIYLFCTTYGLLWSVDAFNSGDPGQDIGRAAKRLSSVPLMELVNANMAHLVDGVLKYRTGHPPNRIYFGTDGSSQGPTTATLRRLWERDHPAR